MNSKDESGSPYPGIVYRVKDSSTEELSAAANNSVSLKPSFSSETTTNVVIKRIDGILYISINDGEDTQVIDMTDMIYTFNTPVTFGASLTGSGSPQRYFIGTLSNMYIKLGTYKDSNKHTIRLDANGGTVSPKKKSVVKGEQIGELPTPTKDGFTFMGWVENLVSGPIIEETYTPSSDMYLYAKYYKSIDDATVSPTEITMEVGEHETIRVSGAGEEYTFSSKNSSIATVDSNGKVTGVSKGTTTIEIIGTTSGKKVTIPVTVLSNVFYKVTFINEPPDSEFSEEATVWVREDTKIGELPPASYEDYIFRGWYTSPTDGSKITENTIITGEVTYYAQYTLPYAYFKPGQFVNAKMKQLSGQSDADYLTVNTTITSIEKAETKPDDSILIDDNIVSTDYSIRPIYMWYEDGTIYYYSTAKTIYLGGDSSYMFYRL